MTNIIVGSIVIVKFFTNSLEDSYNTLITRTLKKIGVINRSYTNDMPKNGELWRVKIINEICEGQSKGCFILDPLKVVDPKTIIKLVPGMYTDSIENKILFVYPKSPEYNCILPLDLKRKENYRAILVKLN